MCLKYIVRIHPKLQSNKFILSALLSIECRCYGEGGGGAHAETGSTCHLIVRIKPFLKPFLRMFKYFDEMNQIPHFADV